MSIARGLLTGFLGGAIADKKAKDTAHLEVVKNVRTNYFNNTLPETIEAENTRKTNYELLAGEYGVPAANVFDANDFTVNKLSMERLDELMEKNKLDKTKLEAANFGTTYEDRYSQRGVAFEDKYKSVFNQLGVKQIGSMGPYTVKSQLEGDATVDMSKAPTTPMEENIPVSSMQVSDFLIPTGLGVALDPGKFAKASQSYRGFGEIFKIDPVTKELKPDFGNRGNEYTAFQNITQEYLSQFGTGKEGEASLTAAMSFADKVLDERVSNIIFGFQTAEGRVPGMVALVPSEKGGMKPGTSFSPGFLNNFQTAKEQKQYIAQHIKEYSLATQRYFAESFPEKVQFSDGTDAKLFLLQITGLAN